MMSSCYLSPPLQYSLVLLYGYQCFLPSEWMHQSILTDQSFMCINQSILTDQSFMRVSSAIKLCVNESILMVNLCYIDISAKYMH
jgi:hypothetical protein